MYVPDPRAGNLALTQRPADMTERDWFGVSEQEMRRYESLTLQDMDLTLTAHLMEASRESTALMWGEIAAGVLTGASAGTMIGGYAVDNYYVAGAGLGGAIFFGLGLTALLIIDVIDIGSADLLYPKRLENNFSDLDD